MFLVNKTQYSTSPAHIIDGDDTVCRIIKRVNLNNWDYVENPGSNKICKKCSPPEPKGNLTFSDVYELWGSLDIQGAAKSLYDVITVHSIRHDKEHTLIDIYVPDFIGKYCTDELFGQIRYVLQDAVDENFTDHVRFSLTQASKVAIKTLNDQREKAREEEQDKGAQDKGSYTEQSEEFLKSREWRELRYKVIQKYGAKCMNCGAVPGPGSFPGDDVYMCVDHIKPRYKYPELKLDFDNLQVLCNECNHGKGAWDETDYRNQENDQDVTVNVSDDGTININITLTIKR